MPPSGSSPRFTVRRIAIGAALSLVGVALLVWQIESAGPDKIGTGLAQVGWGFLVILALSGLRFVLRSLAWTTLIGERVSLRAATSATIAGDAIGNLTPLSLLVSEPIKAIYLRDIVPGSRSFAALTAENFFYSVSVATFITIGTAAMLWAFVVPPELQLAAILSLALMAGVLVAALWVGWREPALVSSTLRRLPMPAINALVERVRRFETSTYAFARQAPGRLGVVVACETAFHLLSFAEAYYTIWLVTGRSAPLPAFVLDACNRIVNVVFRAMPFRVGVDEYSTGFVAPAVGLTSAVGVTIALVRKGRMLVWAGVGIALGVRKGLTLREVINPGQD